VAIFSFFDGVTLTLIGVPLSRVNSRSGRHAKLLPAIVIYIIYANFMFVARDWFAVGKTPAWLGMWWIHLVFVALGLLLLWRNHVKLS
jgi:lipopolysaccharide export system permease protein